MRLSSRVALAVDPDDLVVCQLGQDLLHAERGARHSLLRHLARLRQLEQHRARRRRRPIAPSRATQVAAADLAGLQVVGAEEDRAWLVRDVDSDDRDARRVELLADRRGHADVRLELDRHVDAARHQRVGVRQRHLGIVFVVEDDQLDVETIGHALQAVVDVLHEGEFAGEPGVADGDRFLGRRFGLAGIRNGRRRLRHRARRGVLRADPGAAGQQRGDDGEPNARSSPVPVPGPDHASHGHSSHRPRVPGSSARLGHRLPISATRP